MKTLEIRQRQANDRMTARSHRSIKQQLAIIATRPGESKREVARLTKPAKA